MRHIFKADENGEFNKEGLSYYCKCVHMNAETPKGWSTTLDEAIKNGKAKTKAKAKKKADVAEDDTSD